MSLVLYHGSRGGVVGDIEPKSRIHCDFGRGFYMGTRQDQAKALVADEPRPFVYSVKLHNEQLPKERVLTLTDMDWAYFILYNRGHLAKVKSSDLYKNCRNWERNNDLIIGPIADDAMNAAMADFVKGNLTDKAFLECIRALDYGIQYVAKTQAACNAVEILSEKRLMGKELSDAVVIQNMQRIKGGQIATQVRRQYRREGRYFDEIIDEIKANTKEKGLQIEP